MALLCAVGLRNLVLTRNDVDDHEMEQAPTKGLDLHSMATSPKSIMV